MSVTVRKSDFLVFDDEEPFVNDSEIRRTSDYSGVKGALQFAGENINGALTVVH